MWHFKDKLRKTCFHKCIVSALLSGWQALFWASIIPVIIILAVGTKLQAILTRMAIEITERHAVVQGMPLVQGSDKYFWFGRPYLVLHLIHFALFQNAFQITYFFWIWYSFGLKSCFHANFKLVIIKVGLGIGVLFVCSYITLPLYALVTQMGSCMKKSIFDEQTSKALKKWHMAARKRHGKAGKSSTRTLGISISPNLSPTGHSVSSGRTLHRFKTTGHTAGSSTYPADEDQDLSDMEAEALAPTTSSTTNLIARVDPEEDAADHDTSDHHHEVQRTHEDDFSFVKPAPPKLPLS
uniref:MLO-like protein n=2 Tax=Rhizophora mucronata TaxID=61149 RepID=A0A2P2KHL1_RHIMU